MKFVVVLAALLAGCSTPQPKSAAERPPTALLMRSVIVVSDELGPFRLCSYTILGNDRFVRRADFCPPIIEVTPEQVQQAREQVDAPLP